MPPLSAVLRLLPAELPSQNPSFLTDSYLWTGYVVTQLVTSCGSDGHSMALTETGEVFSWGDGDFGKLGHDSMLKNRSCPQVVPSLEGLFIEDIAVGCEHVLALSSTGDVYAWGCNSEGQDHCKKKKCSSYF
uniref:Uncharacterized protein n=1 Tax=Stegastes partitus TaxID=144197 RepID=A0A3B5B4H8_9TELE